MRRTAIGLFGAPDKRSVIDWSGSDAFPFTRARPSAITIAKRPKTQGVLHVRHRRE